MQIPFNDLKGQVDRIRPELDAAISRVLDRGWFIHGPEDEAFERMFATYLRVPEVVGVGNGTDALQLALMALGIGAGDEVICPALTAASTALAILVAGAEPVFADVDPVTLTLDPTRLEECLSQRTKAIIPVHLYGLPADMPAILDFAEGNGLEVIEDCAQAHGARINPASGVNGQMAGTMARIGCYSFYPTKNLGAYGDGGAVVSADTDLLLKVRQLANLGQSDRFVHRLAGINSRLDEIQAAILQVLLEHLDENIALRRKRAGWYDNLLASAPEVTLPAQPQGFQHVYHLYVIRHPQRDGLREYLKDQEIGSDVHYPRPLNKQPAFENCRVARGGVETATAQIRNILSLPMYPTLTRQQVEIVCDAVRRFGRGRA